MLQVNIGIIKKGGAMPDKERQFFTVDEALDAVRLAFAQYPAQLNLLAVLWPMVFGGDTYVLQDGPSRRIWAKLSATAKLVACSEDDLKQRIVDRLKKWPPSPDHLARICSRVFGAHAESGPLSPAQSSAGIWIDIDLTGFVCLQCGHCCRTLNYRDGCSVADYMRWQELGRTDILDWVGTIRQNGRVTACRIWMVPGTNRFAETCPWLKKAPDQKRYVCTIHAVRPTICRQYPGSRKHGRMTGCKGV